MGGAEEIIDLSKLDPNFKYEIAGTSEGRTLFYCYQCGTCSSSCPLSEMFDIKPHLVIRMTQLGMREKVLDCKTIWLCATCFNCVERCPQKCELSSVMFAIKNLASRERGVPPGLKALVQNIYNLGRSAEVSDFEEEDRANLKLPKTPRVDVESIRRILDRTGMNKLLEGEVR